MHLKKQFDSLKNRQERRLFALKHITNTNHKELLCYEKISDFTIKLLFYKSIGEKYKYKRTYKAKHNKEREF